MRATDDDGNDGDTDRIEVRRIESYATGNTDFTSSAWNLFLTYG
jgi:hypothetical protein